MIPLENRSTAACWILEWYNSYIVRGINGIILILIGVLDSYIDAGAMIANVSNSYFHYVCLFTWDFISGACQ